MSTLATLLLWCMHEGLEFGAWAELALEYFYVAPASLIIAAVFCGAWSSAKEARVEDARSRRIRDYGLA